VWDDLPGTRLEAERVARLYQKAFPDARRRALFDAGKPALLRELAPAKDRPIYRYLHLATHGYFEPPQPEPKRPAREPMSPFLGEMHERTVVRNPLLLSGLVLSGANESADKGILTAEEVSGLDLRGCDLAVLSACQTGLGKAAGGEGVLGLQRAFQQAGARSLVVSLWSVNDAATSVLMEEFYKNLWDRKLSRAEALRQAQLFVLKHPEKVQQRAAELRPELTKRGVSEEWLRGPKGRLAADLPEGGKVEEGQRRSPPAWWAGFILSGDAGALR
jgi:CHAT domain-containing protein